MAYTILVCDDDTLYGSHKERIMQRSKLVNNLCFIAEPIYRDGCDMTNATVTLEYKLPVSKKYSTINLILSDERYNDHCLKYELPFDTDLTSEAGSVELQLTFTYVELDANGKATQHVRKTSTTTIEVVPIAAWSDIIPDSALSALDQRLIKLDAQMKALNDYSITIGNNVVDNLKYNEEDETLQLLSGENGVGDKVSVRDMLRDGIPVVDINSNTGADLDDNNGESNKDDCSCGHDCNCGDNVVEFDDVTNVKKLNNNNIVEF